MLPKEWERIVPTQIVLAIYVEPGGGVTRHDNRLSHGLVLNDGGVERIYRFSDGRVLYVHGNEIFYLPKGSSYRVESIGRSESGSEQSCYAINFDTAEPFSSPLFSIRLRSPDRIRDLFKEASRRWREKKPYDVLAIRGLLCEIICRAAAESAPVYQPGEKRRRIAPAEAAIAERYTDPTLTVAELAALCGISGTYFRRLFEQAHGVSPLAYISSLRIRRAKEILTYQRLSVAETARISGYADVSYFSREFRRYTGVSPGAFRDGLKADCPP